MSDYYPPYSGSSYYPKSRGRAIGILRGPHSPKRPAGSARWYPIPRTPGGQCQVKAHTRNGQQVKAFTRTCKTK